MALAGALLAGGCGGGSGQGTVVVPGPPAATPTPSPTPTPTPPPTAELLEEQRSNAAVASAASAAYRAGATGRGIKIAILDTGIAPGLGEFGGRIDPASADMAGTRGLVDSSGHGTFMASVAAAARDGSGIHGIAYDATIVSLNISNPSTCTSLANCTIMSFPLIASIDAAIAAKVRVINLSFVFDESYDLFLDAVRRAAAAGIVVVISAGNNDAGGQEPLRMARSFAEAAPGWVIIAGGHDAAGNFDYTYANRAGSGPSSVWYLAALSRDVNMIAPDGRTVTYSGTSPAAAAISGAVALVAQARPKLTGAQIVSLLLDNATDAGAPGRDPVFGNGILNLSKVFAALPPQ
ncbi:hypothetical protein ATB93_10485 [Sphingomonas sp. WG]|nr:hypothetical protein ATB93_10485 [Sphingomonas sp. WG]